MKSLIYFMNDQDKSFFEKVLPPLGFRQHYPWKAAHHDNSVYIDLYNKDKTFAFINCNVHGDFIIFAGSGGCCNKQYFLIVSGAPSYEELLVDLVSVSLGI